MHPVVDTRAAREHLAKREQEQKAQEEKIRKEEEERKKKHGLRYSLECECLSSSAFFTCAPVLVANNVHHTRANMHSARQEGGSTDQ